MTHEHTVRRRQVYGIRRHDMVERGPRGRLTPTEIEDLTEPEPDGTIDADPPVGSSSRRTRPATTGG